MVLDHRSVRKRPVLYPADCDGRVYVFCFQNDADDGHRSATTSDDESHADHDGGDVCGFSDLERAGVVYSHQQHGRNRAAMVVEPPTSLAGCTGQTPAWQK